LLAVSWNSLNFINKAVWTSYHTSLEMYTNRNSVASLSFT